MKLLTEYLDRAVNLERLAASEADSAFRTQLLNQVAAYRKLAARRAEQYGLPAPSPPEISIATLGKAASVGGFFHFDIPQWKSHLNCTLLDGLCRSMRPLWLKALSYWHSPSTLVHQKEEKIRRGAIK